MSLRQDILDSEELTGLFLEGEDLSYLDFSSKTIEDVTLKDVSLISSSFEKASLKNVRIISSDLTSASFEGAFISSSLFSSSLMKGTSFYSSDIRRSVFENIKGLYTIFTEKIDFYGSSFIGTVLKDFDMNHVLFSTSNFSENLKELKDCSINLESASSILNGLGINLDLAQ